MALTLLLRLNLLISVSGPDFPLSLTPRASAFGSQYHGSPILWRALVVKPIFGIAARHAGPILGAHGLVFDHTACAIATVRGAFTVGLAAASPVAHLSRWRT